MKKAFVMLATAVSMSGAFAQTSAPAAAPASATSAPAGKAGHERNVEDRIAYLHAQLKITPAQETQWNAFADVMRNNGETMGQLFQQRTPLYEEVATITTPPSAHCSPVAG